MRKNLIIFISLFFSILSTSAYPWGLNTHIFYTRLAAQNSVLGQSELLKDQFGYTHGINQQLTYNGISDSISQWLQDGAIAEDKRQGTTFRSVNHFHHPLLDWADAGLDDTYLWMEFDGMSSILWAQDGSAQSAFPGGDQSWDAARNHYLMALTAPTKQARNTHAARLFFALGHQVHLLQDPGVPEHSRPRAHPEDTLGLYYDIGLEKWANKIRNLNLLATFAQNPVAPGIDLSVSRNGLVPVGNLVDDQHYDGQNPAAGPDQGLAEYVNANFFGHKSIFRHTEPQGTIFWHPFPQPDSTNLQTFLDGSLAPEIVGNETRFYISKTGHGQQISRFVRAKAWAQEWYREFGLTPYLLHNGFYLDEAVHAEYASYIAPRVVGNCIAGLEYFFRGQLEVETQTSGDITIRNTSAEDMSGNFTLYYDAKDSTRKPVTGALWNLSILAGGESAPLSFTGPDDIAEQGKYLLVFNGHLGAEPDAVTATGWLRKYYWSIAVEYPPGGKYDKQCTDGPGADTDCGTVFGWEWECVRTQICSGDLKAYLLASHDPIVSNWQEADGCDGALHISNLYFFGNRDEVLSKINFQVDIEATDSRMAEDPEGIYNCELTNGKMAYPIDRYTTLSEGTLEPISWTEIPADSPEISDLKSRLFPLSGAVRAAYKATNFEGNEYGHIYPTGDFTYTATEDLAMSLPTELYSQDESTACYCLWSCSEDPLYIQCFNIVGIIEGYHHLDKKVTISSSALNMLIDWPY